MRKPQWRIGGVGNVHIFRPATPRRLGGMAQILRSIPPPVTQRAAPGAIAKLLRQRRARKFTTVLAASLIASMVWTAAAQAADCPREGTLGTSRVLSVARASRP